MKATHVIGHTLIGVGSTPFPKPSGNCFSVEAEGNQYRIVNFNLENLEEAVKRGVDWPIEIKLLSDKIAVIHDPRIPHDWYDDRFCPICCPEEFWPITQKLEREREIEQGVVEIRGNDIITTPAKMVRL